MAEKIKKVSIVILTYNNWQYTKRCLESIFKYTPLSSLEEIIVVDNASTDETVKELKKFKVKTIKNSKNLGFAKGCNQGAKVAKGEYLLFLNNDTEVTKNWLNELLEEIKDKKVGIVGPKLIFPNNLVQHIGISFDKEKRHHALYSKFSADKEQVNKKREFQAIIAACILIRKKLFFEVSGFDEIYKNGSEDVDLCFKVRKKGYRVMYVPTSVVIHHESVSVGKQEKVKEIMVENRKILHSRWDDFIKNDLEDIYYADGFLSLFTAQKKEIEERGRWIDHLERDIEKLNDEIRHLKEPSVKKAARRVKKIFRK